MTSIDTDKMFRSYFLDIGEKYFRKQSQNNSKVSPSMFRNSPPENLSPIKIGDPRLTREAIASDLSRFYYNRSKSNDTKSEHKKLLKFIFSVVHLELGENFKPPRTIAEYWRFGVGLRLRKKIEKSLISQIVF